MKKDEMICGVHPVMEAIRSDRHVEKLLIRRDAGGKGMQELKQLAREAGVPWQPVPLDKLDRLSPTEHQGVIAFISQVPVQDLDGVIAQAYEHGIDPLLIALDGVTDVRNVGAIARSAECFGAHGIVVPKAGTARLGSDAVKSSAGALLRMPVCRVDQLPAALRRAHEHGLRIIAVTEKAEVSITDLDLGGPLVLVMGAEDTGISNGILRHADALAAIPMAGTIGSLNVGVASGVALHEVLRQRLAKGTR
ncbi:MAG TPA: 23S rRNA (guanosine(2251)-2'-O)-methyltransferase RlmB [Flavobacteriales bacterium]|nr:23S rRNA (guanosine(2251)-2'-O)-methyltransferase RlmB [Flavobacteriales bacterium]HRO38745.1 23S rRNA (guanosine(2251)-2'-O)-methyltransferase RlmB [Flavobacteriales bacterium]HRP80294.1 23S rRNA (guanosine(2251)-2'-O)-methyltransferase RlmB [Flavobacteriales bacterium]HRQ83732.1 23S rRNA (guanosine(2251)-2'-O)-methyltransferase RlmB [Flavobacteriales bacterium]